MPSIARVAVPKIGHYKFHSNIIPTSPGRVHLPDDVEMALAEDFAERPPCFTACNPLSLHLSGVHKQAQKGVCQDGLLPGGRGCEDASTSQSVQAVAGCVAGARSRPAHMLQWGTPAQLEAQHGSRVAYTSIKQFHSIVELYRGRWRPPRVPITPQGVPLWHMPAGIRST